MGSILFGRLLFYKLLMEKKTLTEEYKNTSAQWAEMHALFLEVMEELKTSKNLKVWVFSYTSLRWVDLIGGQWTSHIVR